MNKLSKLTALLLALVLALGVPLQVLAEETTPSYIETLTQYLDAANTALEGEILSVEKYIEYLEMTDLIEEEDFITFYNQLTEEQILEMQTYLNDKFWEACVSYTRVGPFLPPVYVEGGAETAALLLMARDASTQANDADGVELNKTVKDNGDGTYTVKLESYAEGTVTTTTTTKEIPCDVILVLDMSSSMDDTLSGSQSRFEALQEACEAFEDIIYEKAAGADKKLGSTDDVAHRVSVITFYSNSEILCGLKDVSTTEGQKVVSAAIDGLDMGKGTCPGKGLSAAHEVFNNTHSGTGNQANDTVTSGDRNRIVIFFTDGYPSTSGPSTFTNSLANNAIAAANTLKVTDGATVYSIACCGVEGVSPTGTANTSTTVGKMNLFLHAVSSNYPTANATAGSSTFSPSNVSESDRSKDYPDYYNTPGNVADLVAIFESIASNVNSSSTSVELGSTSVVKDVVTPYFDLPENASGVKVYTVDVTGFTKDSEGNDVPTWSSTRVEYEDAVVKFGTTTATTTTTDGVTTTTYTTTNVTDAPDTDADPRQNTVWVENFDYKANHVANADHDDPFDLLDPINSGTAFYGRKLVIEFDITPVDGFLGGNDVETNLPGSGIYNDSEADVPDTTIEDFENPPNVDVTMWEIQVVGKHQHLFLSNEADLNELLQSFSLVYQKLKADGTVDTSVPPYEVNGIRNGYATIKFTLADTASGDAMVYTIKPGAEVGTWSYVNTETGDPVENFDVTPFLTDDKEYNISYEVIPSTEGTVKGTTGNLTVGVHVYKPTFTFQDTTEEYLSEETATAYYDTNNRVATETWTHTYYNEITVTITVTYDANGTPSYSYVVTDKDKKVISQSAADWDLSKTIDFAGYGATRDEYYNVKMSGPKPTVKFTYSPVETTWITDGKVTAVECVDVNVTAVKLTSTNTHEDVTFGEDGAVTKGKYTTESVYTEGSGTASVTITKDGKDSEATLTTGHITTKRVADECTACGTSDGAISTTNINADTVYEFVVHIKNAFSELLITKSGLNVGESAIFTVTGRVPDGTAAGKEQTWTIVLTATENNRTPSATITGLLVNSTATVKESGDWSWRYSTTTYTPADATVTIVPKTATGYPATVTVTNSGRTDQWLSDESNVHNDFSKDGTYSSAD